MSFWLFALGAVFVVYALFSSRLSTTAITGPMVFVTVGLIIGTEGLEIVDQPDTEAVTALLEITLAVVLFTDANAINNTAWRTEAVVPGRLLTEPAAGGSTTRSPRVGPWSLEQKSNPDAQH